MNQNILNFVYFLIRPWSCFVAMMGFVSVMQAESWRSEFFPLDWEVPQEREGLSFLRDPFIQDFSFAGYHRGEVDLPEVEGLVVDVVERFGGDPSGERDSTAAIQASLDEVSERGGGVVYLPEGTYRVSVPEGGSAALRIGHSGVVLRGAGVERTKILNTTMEMRQRSVIWVRSLDVRRWDDGREEGVLVTRDAAGPTRVVQVEDVSRFAAGDWVALLNPFTDEIREEGSMVQDLRMVPPGASWVGAQARLRGPIFWRRVEEVREGSRELVLEAPIRWYLLKRDGALVFPARGFLEEVGLEDFSIGNVAHRGDGWGGGDYGREGTGGWDAHSSYLIRLTRVRNSWVQRVSSFDPGNPTTAHMLSNGVLLDNTRGVTLRKVEMQRPQYGGGGGNGYMIRMNHANETLLLHCEVAHSRHGIVFWGMGSNGNVVAFSRDRHTAQQFDSVGGPTRTSGSGSDHHGHFSPSNLIDSCAVQRSSFDAFYRGTTGNRVAPHGQTSSQTVFWNTRGEGGSGAVVRSIQFGHGYIVGTSGVNHRVLTASARAIPERTDPEDSVEGVGRGESLEPSSLYLDQLRRRVGIVAPQYRGDL